MLCWAKNGVWLPKVVGDFNGSLNNAVFYVALANVEILCVTTKNFSVFDDGYTSTNALRI